MATKPPTSNYFETDLGMVINNFKKVYHNALEQNQLFTSAGLRRDIFYGDPIDLKAEDFPAACIYLENSSVDTSHRGGVSSNIPITRSVFFKIMFSPADENFDMIKMHVVSDEIYRYYLTEKRKLIDGVGGLEPNFEPLEFGFDKKRVSTKIVYVNMAYFLVKLTSSYRILR